MPEPLLQLEGIVLLTSEGRTLFKGLDWLLPRGAKVNLLGVVGGAVTALFRLAAGVIHPQEGRILLEGVALGPYTFNHPFIHRGGIGWVPPEGGLIVNQTLLANLALPLRFTKGLGRGEALAKAAQALDQAGLSELAGHRPHVMDVRERWLGALVRASLMEPRLWLIDQPAGDLDRKTLKEATKIVEQAAAADTTLVIAGEGKWIPRQGLELFQLENDRVLPLETP